MASGLTQTLINQGYITQLQVDNQAKVPHQYTFILVHKWYMNPKSFCTIHSVPATATPKDLLDQLNRYVSSLLGFDSRQYNLLQSYRSCEAIEGGRPWSTTNIEVENPPTTYVRPLQGSKYVDPNDNQRLKPLVVRMWCMSNFCDYYFQGDSWFCPSEERIVTPIVAAVEMNKRKMGDEPGNVKKKLNTGKNGTRGSFG